jgi:hypothetical protein
VRRPERGVAQSLLLGEDLAHGPERTTRPSRTTVARWAYSATTHIVCVTTMIVEPASFSRRTRSIMERCSA